MVVEDEKTAEMVRRAQRRQKRARWWQRLTCQSSIANEFPERVSVWTDWHEREGMEVPDSARAVWSDFGGLRLHGACLNVRLDVERWDMEEISVWPDLLQVRLACIGYLDRSEDILLIDERDNVWVIVGDAYLVTRSFAEFLRRLAHGERLGEGYGVNGAGEKFMHVCGATQPWDFDY